MKALVIADDENVISRITTILEQLGCDYIVYRWLLKALDNVEEIAPHLVIISTRDYPRHWKTFVQYAAGIEQNKAPKVILYTDKDFSQDEKKKAQYLGVNGILPAECSDKDFAVIVKQTIESFTVKKTVQSDKNSSDKNSSAKNSSFIFTSPVDHSFVTGTIESYDGTKLVFKTDKTNTQLKLKPGMTVPVCSLNTDKNASRMSAIIETIPESEEAALFTFTVKG